MAVKLHVSGEDIEWQQMMTMFLTDRTPGLFRVRRSKEISHFLRKVIAAKHKTAIPAKTGFYMNSFLPNHIKASDC